MSVRLEHGASRAVLEPPLEKSGKDDRSKPDRSR
jgi:hypothetical protein